MSFSRSNSLHQAYAKRAARAPQQIDLSPEEWEEVSAVTKPIDDGATFCTIAGFWVLAALLLAVIVAAPALQAAARHLT